MVLLGTLGMILLLGAFLANVAGRLRPSGIPYQALNAAGAGLLAWYSVYLGVWVFAILESVWTLAAVWNLIRAVGRGNRQQATGNRGPSIVADHVICCLLPRLCRLWRRQTLQSL